MNKKKIIICDYDNPDKYTFPNFGMGSSEKRLWHFAKTISELSEYEVILTGPLWLPEYIPKAKYFQKRLCKDTCEEFVAAYGKCDFLFSGHEYFDKDEWVEPFEKCARVLFSYQLHPYRYTIKSFNGKDKILFCYSDQMLEIYSEQDPVKALLFHSGVNEEPYFTQKPNGYLLWMGRLDKDKSPHYAILAAERLHMKIKILGKSVYQPEYVAEYGYLFNMPHVELMGVVTGRDKMRLISEAKCGVYTLDKDYEEAGAGVLGEILSCGVPIAGMSWTGNDAVCEAVDSKELGCIAIMDRDATTETIVQDLSECIKACVKLDREEIFKIGGNKYNPERLIIEMMKIVEERSLIAYS